jgi:hypothetical protein
MKMIDFILFSILCFFICGNVFAQSTLVLPEVSQRAEVKQTLGYTEIDIVYHSPNVGGREIWGGLVPYGQVWRAGANENTTISFSDDVRINGNPLQADVYGLHMIPNADESLGNYKMALSKAPADQQERIKKMISSLEKG